MARVTAPVEGFKGEVVGVQFVNGVGETDSEAALAYFTRQGYSLDGETPAEVQIDVPVDKMSVKELRAHAKALGVDLGEATKKADILAVLAGTIDSPEPATGDGDKAGAGEVDGALADGED